MANTNQPGCLVRRWPPRCRVPKPHLHRGTFYLISPPTSPCPPRRPHHPRPAAPTHPSDGPCARPVPCEWDQTRGVPPGHLAQPMADPWAMEARRAPRPGCDPRHLVVSGSNYRVLARSQFRRVLLKVVCRCCGSHRGGPSGPLSVCVSQAAWRALWAAGMWRCGVTPVCVCGTQSCRSLGRRDPHRGCRGYRRAPEH